MDTTRPLDLPRTTRALCRTHVLPALGIALGVLALWAGCVPSQRALYAPVHAQANERLGMSGSWRPGSPEASREVAELLQAPLTADSATRIALLNSATFEAALEELGVRAGALAQAATPENPEIDLELLYARDGDEPPHVELSVVQSLTSLLAIPWRRGMARANLAAGRWRAVAAAVDLAAEARITFYHALAASQILTLQRAIAEAAELSVDLATRLHEAGNITDLALAQEQALLEQALLDLADAELAVRESRERLNATLGLWGEQTGWTISGSIEDIEEVEDIQPADLGQLEADAVARSLALAELRAQADAAAGAVGAARLSSWLPEIGAGVSGSREEGSWRVGPALTLSLPIFDMGQGERATAWARLRSARLQYRARAIEVRSEARALGQRYQAARARGERLRDVVLPLRQRILDETVLQYNAMNASPFELLVARQQQIEASRQYIESLRDAWIAHVAIQQVRAGGSARQGEMPARAATGPAPQTQGH